MDYDFDIYCISSDFLNEYPQSQYPELMCKETRPYACLLIDTHCDYLICVPYRSHINHDNAFMFKGSKRSMTKKSGLDYSKAVLIADRKYIGEKALVDNDEYKETVVNLPAIVSEVCKYVDDYVLAVTNVVPIDPAQFKRKYQYTTLKYFHDILGVSV